MERSPDLLNIEPLDARTFDTKDIINVSDDSKKDVAIFYSRNLEDYVINLEKALKKKGLSIYPVYQDVDIEKTLRDAVNGSKVRVFLVNSQFLEEGIQSHLEIFRSCKGRDTLIISDKSVINSSHRAAFKDFRTETMKNWNFRNIGKVVEFIDELMIPDADSSDNATDISRRSDHDSTTESSDSTFNKSSTTSPVPSGARKRQLLETKTSPQPSILGNRPSGEFKKGWLSVWSRLKLVMMLTFLLALVPPLVMLMSQNATEEREVTTSEKFQRQIEALRLRFEQDPKFWRTVRSTMKKHIIDDDPRQPAVLMLVSTKHAAELREKLAREIAKVYSIRCNNREPVWVSGDDFVAQGHAVVKEKLDNEISFGLSSSCVTVISNFERLPPASTTVFYQFCENDQAPFKKVAVIFTLEISHGSWDSDDQLTFLQDGKIPESRIWDQIVENFLYHSLETRDRTGIMKMDMIGGLLSRITPAVAWVKNEDQ